MCERVADVFFFENGQVAVFGEGGHQIPELQGQRTRSRLLAILERSDTRTRWYGLALPLPGAPASEIDRAELYPGKRWAWCWRFGPPNDTSDSR